jgi:RecA-family ATPase
MTKESTISSLRSSAPVNTHENVVEAFRELMSRRAGVDPMVFELLLDRFIKEQGISSSAMTRLKAIHEHELRPRSAVVPQSFKKFGSTREERAKARISPKVIVENYLYADIALLSAQGGTGKTTMVLYELVNIVLGRPVWGCKVVNPGPCILISAEDPREILLARLNLIMNEMNLTDAEIDKVGRDLLIWDVSTDLCRLIDIDLAGRFEVAGLVDDVIAAAKEVKPVLINFDPIISFGPGVTSVNDMEQALIVAGRRIFRGLDCCVRFVTHVSQNAARGNVIDQYASRGGTALPDGSRMAAVLVPFYPKPSEAVPTTLPVEANTTYMKLARPKLSYCRPQEEIYIARAGYSYAGALADPVTQSQPHCNSANLDNVEAFIRARLAEGIMIGPKELDTNDKLRQDMGIGSRGEAREIIDLLIERQRIEKRVRTADSGAPKAPGSKPTYFHPLDRPEEPVIDDGIPPWLRDSESPEISATAVEFDADDVPRELPKKSRAKKKS